MISDIHVRDARDLIPWPDCVRRAPSRPWKLRLFELRDRVFFFGIRHHRAGGCWRPVYVGPVCEGPGPLSWLKCVGVELGVVGWHFGVAWDKPGPKHWFWKRLR